VRGVHPGLEPHHHQLHPFFLPDCHSMRWRHHGGKEKGEWGHTGSYGEQQLYRHANLTKEQVTFSADMAR
jgi:hypothetical protein